MIDHLIEIVFKNVSVEKIGSLLKDLSESGIKIVSYNFTCNPIDVNWAIEKSIEKVFIENKNFGLFLNLKELNVDDVVFLNCGVAVYKAENEISLEINFQLSDLKIPQIKDLTKSLMKLAKSIAIHGQIDDYFCGIEPAQDTKTRLFTNEQLGPFSFSKA